MLAIFAQRIEYAARRIFDDMWSSRICGVCCYRAVETAYQLADSITRFGDLVCILLQTPFRPKPALLDSFEHWMQTHRGAKPSTLNNYQPHIVELLSILGESTEQLEASTLHSFILSYAKGRSHALTKKRVTAIRMFLRFLIATERCRPCLEAAIPAIAEWPLARLPRYLRPEDVERVLADCTCTTPIGIRDNAILLLLARLDCAPVKSLS